MEKLKSIYEIKKDRIRNRLDQFKKFYTDNVSWFYNDGEMALIKVERSDNERIFEELTFCVLTANTSAVIGMKGVDGVRPVLLEGKLEDLKKALKKAGYRYPNKRAEYIYENREKFRKEYDFDFKKIIESHDDPRSLREFYVKEVKGLGYKEGSHFLRNIGVFGLAILDKHILRTLKEYDVIEELPKYLNRKRYLSIEEKYIDFSRQLEIDMDELDLLLWSMKNGSIMK